MNSKTIIGRSDILSLDLDWDDGDTPSPDAVRKAELLGFEYKPQDSKPSTDIRPNQGLASADQPDGPKRAGEQASLPSVPFWYPISLDLFPEKREVESGTISHADVSPSWENKPKVPPRFKHFTDDKLLEKQLRPFFAPLSRLRRIDIPKTVQKLASGQHLDKLPKKHKRKPAPNIQVVLDRSAHLIPFWTMQLEILYWLARKDIGDLRIFSYCRANNGFTSDHGDRISLAAPNPKNGPLLVLGDLGALSGERQTLASSWNSLARRFCQAGHKPFVFFPGPNEACAHDLKRLWQIIPAETSSNSIWPYDPVKHLLVLASPVIRLEPALLSHLRKALIPNAGISLDIKAWNHPVVEQPSSVAASWSRERIATYRNEFSRLPVEIQKAALSVIRDWRWNLPDEIYFEEILNLAPATKAWGEREAVYATDLAHARAHFEDIKRGVVSNPSGQSVNLQAWLLSVGDRASAGWQEEPLRDAVMQVRRQTDPEAIAPVEPAKIDRPGVDVGAVNLSLSASGLQVSVLSTRLSQGQTSPLATLPSTNGVVELTSWKSADQFPAEKFWSGGLAPAWAEDWGMDEFGPWAMFSLLFDLSKTEGDGRTSSEDKRVMQVMRWIPAGSFKMGSPEEEQGRYDDESPQHEVTIVSGFWLFDTPVTQALWFAVMGTTPSHFQGAERPVEQISWHDAKEFIDKLNSRMPDLGLRLPSEAEWEYACRAGTEGLNYAASPGNKMEGEGTESLGQIAWYADNSKSQTHPVAQKEPNNFGLYDMHGNVWEWCEDELYENYEGAPNDGTAWLSQPSYPDAEGRVLRVIRGGSWSDEAQGVRSAFRYGDGPSNRDVDLGFRCAGGPVELKQEARSAPTSNEGRALGKLRLMKRVRSRVERVAAQSGGLWELNLVVHSSRKRAVVDHKNPQASIDLKRLPTNLMQIRTDKAALVLAPMTKPDWASAIGRDMFGLYADLSIKNVKQRLRWIPPGQFMMGSPETEEGRDEDEGPQHKVTIGTGFWLFDTPVTQALWEALMGKNPSQFVHPERPVESVDWDQACEFNRRLSNRVPDLVFVLPSEAEWEYACRAGTPEATYVGPMEIWGEINAPVLDDIAWYGGNSGRDFDLDNGYDRSSWQEKQDSEDQSAGTRIVKQKRPNNFGLYDMLGNVLEWCEDEWHGSYEGAPNDGTAWLMQASDHDAGGRVLRVFRGGSWRSVARYVRSAFRFRNEPSNRDVNLGFRCAGRPVELRQEARSAKNGLAGDARAEPRGSSQVNAGIDILE